MLVVVLAVLAAAMSAISAAGEQRAASALARTAHVWSEGPRIFGSRGPSRRVGVLIGFALALLSSPLWLASWLLDASGFFVQAAALHLGTLSIVQPLMVTTLLFTLPLAALGSGRRPRLRDVGGAVLICLGLALLLRTRDTSAAAAAHQPALLVALGALLVIAAVLVALARGRSGAARAALLSVSAGVLFAVGAALTKLAAGTAANGGLLGLLASWPGYLLAAVSVTSFALQQAAYAAGSLAAAITAVVITDPLASYALGIVGFGEPMPHLGEPLVLAVLGMVVLALGVAVLAHSPLLQVAGEPQETAASSPVTDTVISLVEGGDRSEGELHLHRQVSSGCRLRSESRNSIVELHRIGRGGPYDEEPTDFDGPELACAGCRG